ncbi:MAG: glycoside hydrolase family 13 protein [Oscillatoriales cyanobacterium RM1_1_9]|nr:glycoside hydrolase family 13 protein [Oscillatoriales cyanobacterium SM2_3_0]NJO44260.1 glycoside hydrolase family 13 protein [Oscillatoriales cyanobacterium RM2_1_1]NJO70873.1 glycoside hydrolase family 13 protein [Oscillatoriales cyanobacterium RM1_1_9]
MEINTPDWVKHAIFYQIFPDRFARTTVPKDALLQTLPWEPWEAAPTPQGYKGGNLWGVIEQLDYLQDLGINAIYFTPIFQSACNHRYHTHDYYQVDPLLGGNLALEELLEAAHQRNIKVVLDGVFNHASRGFYYFNDILENGPHSPWLNWFKVLDWPLSAYDGSKPANYVGWANNRALPEFNHENPDVREYIMQVAEYWIRLGVDGWRLDVPFEIRVPEFWQEFRQRVKAINPEAYIVGEVWTDSRQWLDGNQFDGVMNYLFTAPTIAFTGGDRVRMELVEAPSYFPYPALSAAEYGQKIEELLSLYPWKIQLTQLNLLDSHDTARMLSIVNGDRASVELATLLLFTFPGAPSIYYGDEVGLPGAMDPDCRRSFPPAEQWHQPTFDYHQKLIAIRHQYPALRLGSYRVLHREGLGYGFARILGTEVIIVAVNSAMESAQIGVQVGDLPGQPGQSLSQSLGQLPGQLIYGTGELDWNSDLTQLQIHLPPRQGCMIRL